MSHIAREFAPRLEWPPTDAELRAPLDRIGVSVHDLDDDGAQVREASSLLRTSVLKNSTEAGLVWRELVSRGPRLSVDQTGVTRSLLQGKLSRLGVELKAAPSYRKIGRGTELGVTQADVHADWPCAVDFGGSRLSRKLCKSWGRPLKSISGVAEPRAVRQAATSRAAAAVPNPRANGGLRSFEWPRAAAVMPIMSC